MLGTFHEDGSHDFTKDLKRATELYQAAAAQGNALAQRNLNLLFEKHPELRTDSSIKIDKEIKETREIQQQNVEQAIPTEILKLFEARFQKLEAENSQLKQRLERQEVIVERLAWLDEKVLKELQSHASQIHSLIGKEIKDQHESQELQHIQADGRLKEYHQFFITQLTGSWLACQSIHSGMVANNQQFTSDTLAKGFDTIGTRIPLVGAATGIISALTGAWNSREKQLGVNRMVQFFPDMKTASEQCGLLARQLTLAQEDAIKAISYTATGMLARAKQRLIALKNTITANDADNPVRARAIEDCEKILNAIMWNNLTPAANRADTSLQLLQVIMGSDYQYQSPCPRVASPPITPLASARMATSASSGKIAPPVPPRPASAAASAAVISVRVAPSPTSPSPGRLLPASPPASAARVVPARR